MRFAERSGALTKGILRIQPDFLLYLPDSSAAGVLKTLEADPSINDIPVTREEEGVGILCGLATAGSRAVMLIQDTGLGNSITALTTFASVYHMPIFIIASRTGGAKEINSAVHRYSDNVEGILYASNIYHDSLDFRTPIEHWPDHVLDLYRYAEVSHMPVILLVDIKAGRN